MFLSSRQAGYSNRQQGPKNLEICGVLESDKCEVSGRYFVVGGQIAGYWHILTGLTSPTVVTANVRVLCIPTFPQKFSSVSVPSTCHLNGFTTFNT